MASIMKCDIPKFDGTRSFTMWRLQMKAVLIQHELWDVIEYPDTMTDATMSDDEFKQLQKDIKGNLTPREWKKLEDKTLAGIQLCLAEHIQREVMHIEKPRVLWTKLEELYMSKSRANKYRMKEKFYRLKMPQGTSIQAHLSEFDSIITELESMDIKHTDEDKAFHLILSLPASHKQFKEIMLYGNRGDLNLSEVKASLLSKEKLDTDGDDQGGDAMVVRGRNTERKGNGSRGRSKHRSKSRNPHKNKKCNYCSKMGHIERDCWAKQRDQKQEGKDNHTKPGTSNCVESESDGDGFVVTDDALATTSSRIARDEWVLDTGCTYHMCPHKDWFESYESVDTGVVVMGNDTACKVAGIDSIKIITHDGIVRTLKEVRHIPNMTRNLISLGTLEANGCRYKGEDGVLKVCRGSMILMKGIRKGSLYILQGSTVTGSAAAVLNLDESDSTKLWHMRLGHMGEKRMSMLSKKGYLEGAKIGKLEFCDHCQGLNIQQQGSLIIFIQIFGVLLECHHWVASATC